MDKHKTQCFFLLIFIYIGCKVSSIENGCFRAAVFEHARQTSFVDNIEDIRHSIELNLKIYDEVAKEAALDGANIIVFPEDGILFPIDISRSNIRPYLEDIPNQFNSSAHNPCEEPETNKTRPIIYRLSCMARNNHIYVVANMGSIERCDQELNCPLDGHFQYNTAVIFDDSGNLMAKYNKIHLFGELYFDLPPKPEIVAIDTPFGKLGVHICFDMIYKTPGIYSVEMLSVDTMLFPTWWFDELPFLSASQYQQSWAITNKVNLLAANLNKPEDGSVGSGIYSGDSGAIIYTNIPDGYARLLIADIPISSKSKVKCNSNSNIIILKPLSNDSIRMDYNYINMSLENTEQHLLKKSNDIITKCHNGLCCQLNYTLKSSDFQNNEVYYLIVSNRTRDGFFPWTEEFCAVIKCQSDSSGKCISFPITHSMTTFNSIQLNANFSTKYIYPNVITNDIMFVDRKEWIFAIDDNQTTLVLNAFNKPLLTYGLYGRCYDRDPPFTRPINYCILTYLDIQVYLYSTLFLYFVHFIY